MTGIPSHEHHDDTLEASGQINKRGDKGASYEQQSPGELRVIEFDRQLAGSSKHVSVGVNLI